MITSTPLWRRRLWCFSHNLRAVSSSPLVAHCLMVVEPSHWWPRKDMQQINRVGRWMHGCVCERKHHVIRWSKFNIPLTPGASSIHLWLQEQVQYTSDLRSKFNTPLTSGASSIHLWLQEQVQYMYLWLKEQVQYVPLTTDTQNRKNLHQLVWCVGGSGGAL